MTVVFKHRSVGEGTSSMQNVQHWKHNWTEVACELQEYHNKLGYKLR